MLRSEIDFPPVSRIAMGDARNVALLCGLHGSNLTKNPVMTSARLSACIVATWIP
jgi:hypothetical protein